MSLMLMAQAFGAQVGNAARKLVLLKLADNANDQGECWPSYQYIADQCEISRRSAMDHIEALCSAGLVQKRTRKGPKGNSTNIYVVSLGGENSAPPSENSAPPSETVALPPSENSAPGISHSFESVSESVNEPLGSASADDSPGAAQLDPVNMEFPTKCGKGYRPAQSLVEEIETAYPALDVSQELQRSRLWLIANPSKRKTVRGMSKFLTGWMSRQGSQGAAKPARTRHSGFGEIDYSKGLKQGVPDGVANF